MGTFILRPVTVNSDNNFWAAVVGGVSFVAPTDPQLVSGINGPQSAGNYLRDLGFISPNSPNVTYSCIGLGLYLDGSLSPIDTNNLPTGFTIIDCTLRCGYELVAGQTLNIIRNGANAIIVPGPVIGISTLVLGPINNTDLTTSIIGVEVVQAAAFLADVFDLWIEGTYTQFSITLNPPSGNIHSGQNVNVSSPLINVQEFEYAIIQNDKVIPITPKKNPDGTVDIEIPTPPTDPCFDCLTTCPECDDCLTACEEDLSSEACQACLDACLDCLVDCLEELEEAEECQGSTQDPPGAIPIIIICSGPGFTGSVPLGNFTILVTAASGIYKLVDGKSSDTLYSSLRNGTTYNVKIPNPGAKTGFFRS